MGDGAIEKRVDLASTRLTRVDAYRGDGVVYHF